MPRSIIAMAAGRYKMFFEAQTLAFLVVQI
jgi:biotin synthase-like enzyme